MRRDGGRNIVVQRIVAAAEIASSVEAARRWREAPSISVGWPAIGKSWASPWTLVGLPAPRPLSIIESLADGKSTALMQRRRGSVGNIGKRLARKFCRSQP